MRKKRIVFSLVGAFITIIFLLMTNYLTTPTYFWSINPIYAILLYWLITAYFISGGRYKIFSIAAALISIAYLATINYMASPIHPWFLYAAFPILWWPITQYAGKRVKTFSFSLMSSCSLIAYYIVLNYFVSPAYPWSLYTTFALLWWPIILYFSKNKKPFTLSIVGMVLITIFFIATNIINSPNVIWAVYPIFLALWWPLMTYYFTYSKVNR